MLLTPKPSRDTYVTLRFFGELMSPRTASVTLAWTLIVVALFKAFLAVLAAKHTETYSFGAVHLRAEIL